MAGLVLAPLIVLNIISVIGHCNSPGFLRIKAATRDRKIPPPQETPRLDPTSPDPHASELKGPAGKRQTPADAQRSARQTGRLPPRTRTRLARIRAPELPSRPKASPVPRPAAPPEPDKRDWRPPARTLPRSMGRSPSANR